jgi:hypothetical protein
MIASCDGALEYLCYSFEKSAKFGIYLYSVIDGTNGYQQGWAYLSDNTISISRTYSKNDTYSITVQKESISAIKLFPN